MVAWRCAALRWESILIAIGVRLAASKQGQGVGIFARLGSCQVDPRPFLDLKCRYGNAFNFPPIKSPILPLSPNQRNASPANKLTADRRIFPNPANKRWELGSLVSPDSFSSQSSHPNSRRIRAARWPCCPTWQKDPTYRMTQDILRQLGNSR